MELKLRIRQAVQYQKTTGIAGYYYQGTNPQALSFVTGTLPASRQWKSYPGYIDVTGSVSDIYKLKLTWTTAMDGTGNISAGGTEQKKSASGTLSFEGEAYNYLKAWLIDDVSAPLNSVDVQVWHIEGGKPCGIYENYTIKATELTWCEGNACNFDLGLKQKDEPLNCIRRTLVTDNHQNWFQTQPGNGKQHPRFSYCNEVKPNGLLVAMWYIMSVLFFIMSILVYILFPPILLILYVLRYLLVPIINTIINAINLIPGVNVNTINVQGLDDAIQTMQHALQGGLFDGFAQMYMESAGCGREHPAPLIRDYIKNVCDKCGIGVNSDTADIFFAQQISLQTSDPNRGYITADNPHYNACYLNAPVKRGIRRFSNLSILGLSNPNNTDFYIPENGPVQTLDVFLNELKKIYNAEWVIRPVNQGGQAVPHLYFKRKDYFSQPQGSYAFDLSAQGADRNKILEGICYEWNGKKAPAYVEGLYTPDAADTCGNEAASQADGYVSYGNVDDNPNLDGGDNKRAGFGAVKFRLDGASTDYIMDAMQWSMNLSYLTLFTTGFALPALKKDLQDYADFGLLMTDETCTLPKVLIWDGHSYMNAKCSRTVFAVPGIGNFPQINTKFNNPPQAWDVAHKPETAVVGSSLSGGGAAPYGVYEVRGVFGGFIYQQPASLINYPMYFGPGYYDTMWDWFHWIDDPRLNPALNQDWQVKLELCCGDLKNLRVFNDAADIALGSKVKLPDKYYPDGRITEITVSYDPADTQGQYIELRGTR